MFVFCTTWASDALGLEEDTESPGVTMNEPHHSSGRTDSEFSAKVVSGLDY